MKKISFKFYSIGRDLMVNKLLTHFNMSSVLVMYNIVTASPLDVIIFMLSTKFGISKIAIMLIIAFL